MLRTIFVVALIIIGAIASFYGSFNALMFYLWVAYFRPESWMWSSFLLTFRLSLLVAIFLLISTLITRVKLKFTWFSGLLSVILIHSLLSAILSFYSQIAISAWISFLQLVVISYLITMLVRSERDLKITLIVISLSLGLEGAKQGWVHLLLHPGSTNNNTHPVLGDNNGVAVGMLMIVPILIALYQTTERKLVKYSFLFLAIGVMYRALSTYSRGGFLAFLVMCAAYWLRSKNKFILALVAVLFFSLIFSALPQTFWDRMDTITASGEDMDDSAAGRIYFWKLAFEMAKSNPVFGVGHSVYREAYSAFDYTGDSIKRSVHSAWFGILAEWGFTGIALFLYVYCYSFFSCIQARNKCKYKQESKPLLFYINGIETSLITAGVGITFLSQQYLEILWHFFALATVCNQIHNAQNATNSKLPENDPENTVFDRTTT